MWKWDVKMFNKVSRTVFTGLYILYQLVYSFWSNLVIHTIVCIKILFSRWCSMLKYVALCSALATVHCSYIVTILHMFY